VLSTKGRQAFDEVNPQAGWAVIKKIPVPIHRNNRRLRKAKIK
jgi:hypothetical protein